MKKILLSLFMCFAIIIIVKAQPLNTSTFGLNGYYDIANWDQFPNSGNINTAGAPNSIVFTSGDDNESDTSYISILAPNTIVVKINWTYETNDYDGPEFDYPVYIINGVIHKFNSFDLYGPDEQSGLETFTVRDGQTFGFGAYTFDGIYGECTINSVSFEFETVPVGISVVLGAFGLVGVSFLARRRLRKNRNNS
jgi:hypothetical protein